MIDAALCSRALDLYAHVLEGMALDATERNRVALADVRLREAAECREEAARLREPIEQIAQSHSSRNGV